MRRFPPGPGPPFGREGPDDYDEELRAFSRKREREKRRRQESTSDSVGSSSGKGDDSRDEEGSESRRKQHKVTKGKEKKKVTKKSKKEPSDEGRQTLVLVVSAPLYQLHCWHFFNILASQLVLVVQKMVESVQVLTRTCRLFMSSMGIRKCAVIIITKNVTITLGVMLLHDLTFFYICWHLM